MVVRDIVYHPNFVKQLQRLSSLTQKQAVKIERLFRLNALHPSLRLHRLGGQANDLWSISVSIHVRIIFKRMPDGVIFFLKIGHHDIYRSLT